VGVDEFDSRPKTRQIASTGLEVPLSKATEYEEMMREVTAFLIEKALSEKPSSSYFGGKVTATEYACSRKESTDE